MDLLWALIAILVVLWLLGWAGPRYYGDLPRSGHYVHILLIVAALLVILILLGVL